MIDAEATRALLRVDSPQRHSMNAERESRPASSAQTLHFKPRPHWTLGVCHPHRDMATPYSTDLATGLSYATCNNPAAPRRLHTWSAGDAGVVVTPVPIPEYRHRPRGRPKRKNNLTVIPKPYLVSLSSFIPFWRMSREKIDTFMNSIYPHPRIQGSMFCNCRCNGVVAENDHFSMLNGYSWRVNKHTFPLIFLISLLFVVDRLS